MRSLEAPALPNIYLIPESDFILHHVLLIVNEEKSNGEHPRALLPSQMLWRGGTHQTQPETRDYSISAERFRTLVLICAF